MNAYDIPDAIHWHDGLLLTPQHFQQLSWRHEALVQYGTSMTAPYYWGLRRFKHDPISLPAGKLRVVELEAIMPDGLVVSHGQNSLAADEFLEIDLGGKQAIGDDGVLVYLAVALSTPGKSNGDGRYEAAVGNSSSAEIPTGGGVEIHRFRPQLSLHTKSMPANCIGFPLAKIVYNESSFALDESYIPPTVVVPVQARSDDVGADAIQRLGDKCSEIAQEVRRRAMQFADRGTTLGIDGELVKGAPNRHLLLSLVGALPYFEAILKTGVAHPFSIYLALCSMAGQLAVVGSEMVPPDFNAYNHNDLNWTFNPVFDFINLKLDQGVPQSYQTYRFERIEDIYELHQFDRKWMTKRLAIAIKGQRGMSEAEVIKWGSNCLIGSKNRIDTLKQKRITGAVRKHVERVADIVPAKGFLLFSVNPDVSFIEPDRALQIFNPDEKQPAEIVLHVLNTPVAGPA